jgi:CRP/FNR family cyclic AMP-dependent transcriptional regulator
MDERFFYFNLDQFNEKEEFVQKVLQNCPVKCFQKGEVLYRQGEDNDIFYLLLEGKVESYYINRDGRKKTIGICEPRMLIGEFVFDRYPNLLTGVCLTKCKAAVIRRQDAFHWDEDMLRDVANSLCWKLRTVIGQLADQTFDDVEERIENLLIGLTSMHGKTTPEGSLVEIPLTHQMIADIVGSSRVRVTQALTKMTKEKKISISKDKYYFIKT